MSRQTSTLWTIAFVGLFLPFGVPAHAADLPFESRQAVTLVECGDQQGSGTVINSDKGYVLTNAHVLVDEKTNIPAKHCVIGFINDSTLQPTIFYSATPDRYVFDEDHNLDWAILLIGRPLQNATLPSFPMLKTDEFSRVNDGLRIVSYPGSANGTQTITAGTINGLAQGIIKTDAPISPGSSGGAGIDQNNHLVGMATRILYLQDASGNEKLVDYELVDIRSIITWLDTFGVNVSDTYLTHADPARYLASQALIQPSLLNCTLLAKSMLDTSVYCLKNDGTRQSFPNNATYLSWFGDFSAVQTVSLDQLAQYRLNRNVTMKPGTLVKITTDPHVYVVSDSDGTLRLIPTEAKAQELYGDGWAGYVKDVPDEFFINYHVGLPVE